MQRLNPKKLYVTYLTGTTPEQLAVPRRYTLTHSDRTGELFLSIGSQYNIEQISKLYTRLMRDEVLSEIISDRDRLEFRVYCHISGGFVFGWASWRYKIFCSELRLVLEAIRYGDSTLFSKYPELDRTPINVHFQSNDPKYKKAERWGVMADYAN